MTAMEYWMLEKKILEKTPKLMFQLAIILLHHITLQLPFFNISLYLSLSNLFIYLKCRHHLIIITTVGFNVNFYLEISHYILNVEWMIYTSTMGAIFIHCMWTERCLLLDYLPSVFSGLTEWVFTSNTEQPSMGVPGYRWDVIFLSFHICLRTQADAKSCDVLSLLQYPLTFLALINESNLFNVSHEALCDLVFNYLFLASILHILHTSHTDLFPEQVILSDILPGFFLQAFLLDVFSTASPSPSFCV